LGARVFSRRGKEKIGWDTSKRRREETRTVGILPLTERRGEERALLASLLLFRGEEEEEHSWPRCALPLEEKGREGLSWPRDSSPRDA